MLKDSIKRLEYSADSLQKFFELEETEREWIYPLFSKNIQSTIQLLALIEYQGRTYIELAEIVGYHHNTVRQKLLALKRGGFPIFLTECFAVLETGRKRILSSARHSIVD